MSFLPVFQLPSGAAAPSFSLNPFTGSVPIFGITHDVILPAGMTMAYGFGPVTVTRSVDWVGAVFLDQGHSVILANTNDNICAVTGGDVSYGDPRDCINRLLERIAGNLQVNPHEFFECDNPATGKRCRIYMVRLNGFSCTRATASVQGDPVLRAAIHTFVRLPVTSVRCGQYITDRGIPCHLNALARVVVSRL
jgi:hypothetical protein